MKRLLIALAIAATPALAQAALPRADRAALLAPAHPAIDTRVAQLPPVVRAAYGPGLADAGAPFQVTDVVVGKPLPGARVVWGARVGRLYVLHTEFGGFAHAFALEVFDGRGRIWKAWMPRPLPTFAAFQAALRANKLSETP